VVVCLKGIISQECSKHTIQMFPTCSSCRISPLHDIKFWEASAKSISLPMKNVHEQVTEHNYLGLLDLITLAAVLEQVVNFALSILR